MLAFHSEQGSPRNAVQSLGAQMIVWQKLISWRFNEIKGILVPEGRDKFIQTATTQIQLTQNERYDFLKQIQGLPQESVFSPLPDVLGRMQSPRPLPSSPPNTLPNLHLLIVPPASSISASPSSLSPPPILVFPPASPPLPSPPILDFIPPTSFFAQAASSSSSSASSSAQAVVLAPLDEPECSVCLESFIKGMELMSAHSEHRLHLFCIGCIDAVFRANRPCPICRAPIILMKHTF